jgi:hypothetical protein
MDGSEARAYISNPVVTQNVKKTPTSLLSCQVTFQARGLLAQNLQQTFEGCM